jgi:hypothetical protein
VSKVISLARRFSYHIFVSTNYKTKENLSLMKKRTTIGVAAGVFFTAMFSTVSAQQAMNVQMSSSNPTCNGYNNGEVVLTITGGTLPYTVNGAPIKGSQLIVSSLGSGNYNFSVDDVNGNNVTAYAQISEPQPLGLMSVVTNVSANGTNDGAINLIVPNVPLTFEWLTYGGTTPVTNEEDQAGLGVGIYKVIITESNGCKSSKRFEINQDSPFLSGGYNPIVTEGVSTGNQISSAIVVYPNPSVGQINLRSTVDTKEAVILNDMGVVVHTCSIRTSGDVEGVNLHPGSYLLVTTDITGAKQTERIVIR